MRCLACNNILTEAEDRRKYPGREERVQLCAKDAAWLPVDVLPTDSDNDNLASPEPDELELVEVKIEWDDEG